MISYQTDGIEMPAIKKRETTEWIKAVAATYNKRIGEIAYIFCSDEKILEVNRQYLQHDYYTDIITFDYCEGNRLSGDLFISLDTVRTNAQMLNEILSPDQTTTVLLETMAGKGSEIGGRFEELKQILDLVDLSQHHKTRHVIRHPAP